MKAIIMAGGKGTRISRYIGDIPKCTVDIGGVSLIRHTVEMLLFHNIEVNLVLGFQKDIIINELKGLPVNYFYNPFFDITNSIASLWFAQKAIEGESVILANGDVYWAEDVLKEVLADKRDVVMLADSSRLEEGDYLFYYQNEKLINHGKHLNSEDCTGEYVGIAKIHRSFYQKFFERHRQLIETQHHSLWWENVLYSFISERPIYVRDINGKFWSEIDYIEDYHRIINFRTNNKLNCRELI